MLVFIVTSFWVIMDKMASELALPISFYYRKRLRLQHVKNEAGKSVLVLSAA